MDFFLKMVMKHKTSSFVIWAFTSKMASFYRLNDTPAFVYSHTHTHTHTHANESKWPMNPVEKQLASQKKWGKWASWWFYSTVRWLRICNKINHDDQVFISWTCHRPLLLSLNLALLKRIVIIWMRINACSRTCAKGSVNKKQFWIPDVFSECWRDLFFATQKSINISEFTLFCFFLAMTAKKRVFYRLINDHKKTHPTTRKTVPS